MEKLQFSEEVLQRPLMITPLSLISYPTGELFLNFDIHIYLETLLAHITFDVLFFFFFSPDISLLLP